MTTKRVLLVLLGAFVLFWMWNDPDSLADSAGAAAAWGWQVLVTLFEGLIRFLEELS